MHGTGTIFVLDTIFFLTVGNEKLPQYVNKTILLKIRITVDAPLNDKTQLLANYILYILR